MRPWRLLRLSIALCAGMAAGDAPGVARADALAAGTRVCLHSAFLPFAEPTGDDRRADFEERVRAALEAASFEVVPPSEVEPRVEGVVAASEGIFDPATGERLVERHRALQHDIGEVLARETGCAARIHASVVVVHAIVDGWGVARWDGAEHGPLGLKRDVVVATESSWLTALSLWIHATDLEGSDLAFRSGGIERLVDPDWYPFRVDLLPEDAWLRDTARVDRAIAEALGPGGESLRTRGSAERLARTRAAEREERQEREKKKHGKNR